MSLTLYEDGHFKDDESDVEDSVMTDDYYEAPAGCCFLGECTVKGEHLLSDCWISKVKE